MKHYLPNSLRALFLSLAVLLSLPMLAAQVEIDGINYKLNAEARQATVIAKSSGEYSGEVVIPESVEHEGAAYSVTSIGDDAFILCYDLTSVTIGNSVTSIGDNAFYYCKGLTSVTIGNSVTSIGERAFAECSRLTSVTIGNSVTSIGLYAFWVCSGLTSVTIPNSVTSIGERAFSGCSGLTSIVVEDGNPVYDSRNNCNAIIETATNTLHSGCKTTIIPNSVTSIGSGAFYECSGLTSVTIGNSVTSIGNYAFSGCSGLTSVTIPNSVKSIGDNAFNGCSGLTSVTIPNSVTSIGSYAFGYCSRLTSVTIPNSVTSVGERAFSGCSGLTSIVVEDGNPVYDSRNDCNAIIETATNTLHSGCKTTIIPNSVTSIGTDAFGGCSGLTSVTIGSGVESIGNYAFYACPELLDVYCYAENVPSTESDAFNRSYPENATLHVPDASVDSYKATTPWRSFGKIVGLSGEEPEEVEIDGINYELNADAKQAAVIKKSSGAYSGEVVIPESVEHEGAAYSVTSIGERAFYYCSGLTSVTIPNSVTSIGDYAFSGCSGLTSVTIPNSVTSIGRDAFSDCSGLTSVTIGNSVTSIGICAFEGCSGLTSVTIPNSVTSIGNSAFRYCSGLTSVTIGSGVTSIGFYAFCYCSGLTSVTIGSGVESIGNYAFAGCSELLDVYCYAEKVPSTESDVFKSSSIADATLHVPDASVDSYKASYTWSSFGKIVGLYDIEIDGINYKLNAEARQATVIAKSRGKYSGEVVIPESVEYEGSAYSVTSIGSYAFCDCSGLTSVTIPNSVTSIGVRAFSYCSGLTSVHISDIAAWCKIDFDGYDSNPLYYAHHLYLNGEEVKDLVIPNSVTSIENYAFEGCSGLTSVTIPNSVTSIGYGAFSGCSGLTSVTIPNSVTSIGSYAFSDCPDLLDVYCYAEKVPSTGSDAFNGSYPEYATLHVPDASIDSYKATAPWSSFGKIVGLSGEEPEQPEQPEVEKCATPVVTYVDGCLEITCETEGAEFITDIADNDIKKHYESKIELSATYNIEVYATKANCENSDIVNVALVWVENGDVDEETGVISVPAAPVLVQGNGGVLSVSGVAKGTDVVVYTISGTEVARSTATDGTATISTGLQSGTIVVVKFGNKSVKLRI